MESRLLPRFEYFHTVGSSRRSSFIIVKDEKGGEPEEKFVKVKSLGSGLYGEVFLFSHEILPAKQVVVKKEIPNREGKFLSGSALLQEGAYWKKKYGYAAFAGSEDSITEPHYLLLNFIEGQSLTNYNFRLSVEYLLTIFINMLADLKDLHALGLVHGDINKGNILIDSAYKAHLIDFGFTTKIGTPVRSLLTGSSVGSSEHKKDEVTMAVPNQDIKQLGVIIASILYSSQKHKIRASITKAESQGSEEILVAMAIAIPLGMMHTNPDMRISSDLAIEKFQGLLKSRLLSKEFIKLSFFKANIIEHDYTNLEEFLFLYEEKERLQLLKLCRFDIVKNRKKLGKTRLNALVEMLFPDHREMITDLIGENTGNPLKEHQYIGDVFYEYFPQLPYAALLQDSVVRNDQDKSVVKELIKIVQYFSAKHYPNVLSRMCRRIKTAEELNRVVEKIPATHDIIPFLKQLIASTNELNFHCGNASHLTDKFKSTDYFNTYQLLLDAFKIRHLENRLSVKEEKVVTIAKLKSARFFTEKGIKDFKKRHGAALSSGSFSALVNQYIAHDAESEKYRLSRFLKPSS